MKYISIGFLFFSLIGFAQKSDFQFGAKPDSIIEETEYGYIYITSDTSSEYYDWIIPSLDEEMIHTIQNLYFSEAFKKINFSNSLFDLGSFPRKWNAVYRYQNQYFLYAPSDWMSNLGFYLTDSIVYHVQSDWDPITDYILKDFYLSDVGNATCNTINLLGQENKITINLIEKSLGIYEWSIYNRDEVVMLKFLMQNSDFSKKLRMIVSDCGDRKCIMEFHFNN